MAEITRLPGPVADLWDWQLDGACRRIVPRCSSTRRVNEGTPPHPGRAAKEICLGCPVLQQCREPRARGARALRRLGWDHRGRARSLVRRGQLSPHTAPLLRRPRPPGRGLARRRGAWMAS